MNDPAMNEIEYIKRLDIAAGSGEPIDVTDRVLRQVRPAPLRIPESPPMWIGALLSTLAAAVVFLIAFQALSGLQDPFGDLFTPLLTVFQ
jgi:hypothetical protein